MSFEIRFPAIATERELADKPFSSKEHYFKKRWTRATCRLNTPLVSLRRTSGIPDFQFFRSGNGGASSGDLNQCS